MYGGRLVAAESVASHLLCDLPAVQRGNLTESPLLLVDSVGCGMSERRKRGTMVGVAARAIHVSAGDSKLNEGEADVVRALVNGPLAAGVQWYTYWCHYTIQRTSGHHPSVA